MAKTTHVFSILVVFFSLAIVAHSSCTYVVKVKTGDRDSAGTDATVSLRLFNNRGNSIDVPDLRRYRDGPNSRDYFERGQLDTFKVPSGECLNICKIELSHNNSGKKAGWYVDYLELTIVHDQTGQRTAVKTFEINQWLARDEPPHYSTSVIKNKC